MPAVAGRAVFEAELALVLGRDSLASLLAPPRRPGRMHVVRHLRAGGRVFETYWAALRGVQSMDYSCDQHCKAGNND